MRVTMLVLVCAVCAGLVIGCDTQQSDPALSWKSPAVGAEVYGLLRLHVTARGLPDDAGVSLALDDTPLGTVGADDAPDYRLLWDSTVVPNGEHTLHAAVTYSASDGPVTLTATRTIHVNNLTRQASIPADAVKMTPASDPIPPRLNPAFAAVWAAPVPLEGLVNTAGAEDAPFITPDGDTLYFFFTPDMTIPATEQVGDKVTGIYRAQRVDGVWSEPARVWLNTYDTPALDGAPTVHDAALWFASARQGNFRGVDMWTATWDAGLWVDWTNAGQTLNAQYEIGEMHVSAGGQMIYFDSRRAGGQGEKDIWLIRQNDDGTWGTPEPITAVNTPGTEGWPFVSADGSELWFTRFEQGFPAIYRSLNVDGAWQPPELIVSHFAGEPTLDRSGNLYFVHHFIRDAALVEADIYVAYRR